jgi:tetratricopeptide (TPR) repeat protein
MVQFAAPERDFTRFQESPMKRLVIPAVTILFSAGLMAGTANLARAAGDTTATDAEQHECDEGMVWDAEADNEDTGEKGKCVDAAEMQKDDTKSESDQQGMLYDYGRAMAKAGHYEKAIAALKLAPDQTDPRVLNYLGYSNRKLGHMDQALHYYHAAVAQNPDYSLVREYLGEAYIQLGLLEKAREQLSEIERICGSKSCGEYGQLAELMVDRQLGQ